VLSEKNWKLESVLRLLVGGFMVLCLGSLLTLLVREAADPEAAPSVGRILVSAVCFHVGVIALVWRFLYEHKVSWATGFGFRHAGLKAMGWGALAILLFLPVGWALQFASLKVMAKLGIEPSLQLALQALQNSGSALQLAALAGVTIIIAPIAEEALFRGILYPLVKQAGFPKAALWGTSVVFALIHFNLAIFFPLLLLALVLVWLYEKTDNLLAPIAAHATFNAINFALFFVVDDFRRSLPGQP